jgi:hypothetical protein
MGMGSIESRAVLPQGSTGGVQHRTVIKDCLVVLSIPILVLLTVALLATSGSEASEIVDNYEWKVHGMCQWSGYNQYSEALITDEVTGDVYVVCMNRETQTYAPPDGIISCARFDPATGKLVNRWTIDYKGNPRRYASLTDRAYLVHDGQFYFLWYSMEDLRIHLWTNGVSEDLANWSFPSNRSNQPPPHYRIIGIHNERFYFMVREVRDDETWFYLYVVELHDFSWRRRVVMMVDFYVPRVEYLLQDGKVYVLMTRSLGGNGSGDPFSNSYDLMLDMINLTTGYRMYPRALEIGKSRYWDGVRFDMDSKGDLHILRGEEQELFKVSTSGEVLASVDLETLWGDANETYRLVDTDVLVNRTDCIYIIGRTYPNHYASGVLVCFVLPPDYSVDVLRHIISEDDPRLGYRHRQFGMNGTGSVFISWHSLVDDLSRVLFTHQIPLTPDLEPSTTGFRVIEVPGTPEPVTFLVQIDNVGRAPCVSHWVELSFLLNGSGRVEKLVDHRVDRLIGPGESYVFEFFTAIPQGSHILRVTIHDVSPYENNVDNNVMETWFYVANNNPPTVEVISPQDSSTIRGTLMLAGVTKDLETWGNVTTYVTGLPGISVEIEGRGFWNQTVDVTDVLSGEYILSFQAFDGADYSGVVYRRVRVSRDVDRLRLVSLHPHGDVTLIEGDEETFYLNASDPLARPLDHRWRIDAEKWRGGSSHFLFITRSPGRYVLSVEVTNGITSFSHRWNVTVLKLIPPSISGFFPRESSIFLGKRVEINLSLDIINPHEQPYTVIWTLNNEELSGNEVLTRSVSFVKAGHHIVTAHLLAATTTDIISWNIYVSNKPPTIESWRPSNLTLKIVKETHVEFEISVQDPDGDELTYQWTIADVPISNQGLPSARLLLSLNNGTVYAVQIWVSDGDERVTFNWTVQPEPPDRPAVSSNDAPWYTARTAVLMLLVLLGIVASSVYYVRARLKRDLR